MIFNHVWSVIFFTYSNVSCCPVQKNGLGAIALFQGLQSKTHGPCTRHVWPFSRHVWPFSRFSFLLWLPFIFLASAHPHNLSPGRVFIFLFLATLGVEWLWQRPLRCCFATSFGFGPCPFGFVWPLWPPTIRALSSIFSFTAAAVVAGGAGLALLCACQIMVVKKGYGIS